jgi:hypothetical protein
VYGSFIFRCKSRQIYLCVRINCNFLTKNDPKSKWVCSSAGDDSTKSSVNLNICGVFPKLSNAIKIISKKYVESK